MTLDLELLENSVLAQIPKQIPFVVFKLSFRLIGDELRGTC